METRVWAAQEPADRQLEELVELAGRAGVVVIRFDGDGCGTPPAWRRLEPWTRSRAVTIAEIGTPLGAPGLEVALTSDIVVMRPGAGLRLPGGNAAPSAGLLWALGRAGTAALRVGLLEPHQLTPDEALRLGLAHHLLSAGQELPVGDGHSPAALVAARDLLRARGGSAAGALALELATFRLLFAVGHPGEGARAFLERRPPVFE